VGQTPHGSAIRQRARGYFPRKKRIFSLPEPSTFYFFFTNPFTSTRDFPESDFDYMLGVENFFKRSRDTGIWGPEKQLTGNPTRGARFGGSLGPWGGFSLFSRWDAEWGGEPIGGFGGTGMGKRRTRNRAVGKHCEGFLRAGLYGGGSAGFATRNSLGSGFRGDTNSRTGGIAFQRRSRAHPCFSADV